MIQRNASHGSAKAILHSRFGNLVRIGASVWFLSGCISIAPSELQSIGTFQTTGQVDFVSLQGDAARANVAYASEAIVRSKYPSTIRVSAPGEADVLYFLERDDGAKTQYITVRGTMDKRNLSEDLDRHVQADVQTGVPLHAGFDMVADALYADLRPYLKQGYKTYLTGHSLGGAVAAILAMYAVRDGHDVARVVTFGQPRFTTLAGIDDFVAIPIIRVVDENDVIPMLPPATRLHAEYGPYEHVGPEVILLEGPHYVYLGSHDANRVAIGEFWRSMSFANLNDHKMTNYLERLDAKVRGAVQVPYSDRQKYVAPPP